MSLVKKCFLLVVFCIACGALHGQKKEADEFFEQGKYFKALKLYNLYDKIDKRPNALINRGICNYHSNKLDNCILDMKKAFGQGKRTPEIYLYLGKAYHDKMQFESAADFYKMYLDKIKNDPEKRRLATIDIKQCGYAFNAQYKDEKGIVENLGDIINTRADEILAIESPNVSGKIYFSANREGATGGLRGPNGAEDPVYGDFKMDLYSSIRDNGRWLNPESLNPLLNSAKNEVLQDISDDGSILFYASGTNINRMPFMVDTFSVDGPKVELDPLIGPFVGELGDRDLVSINDSTYIFASKRVGGYGGYDLYLSTYRDGKWQESFNLGPSINSPFDEVSPWISNDGNRIYFSTNRIESFGGFDIYTAFFDSEKRTWTELENMALPINSPRDDLYFRVSRDGKMGYFSSDRKSGEGGFDLYRTYLRIVDNSQLVTSEVTDLYALYHQEQVENMAKKARIDSILNAQLIVELDTSVIKLPGDTTETIVVEEVKKKMELIVEPMFYGEDDNMLTSANIRKLNSLADALKLAPEIRVLLISNSVSEDLAGFDLYFSYKRGEKLMKYLKDKGVNENQIILIGAGSQYPIVKERINGKRIDQAEVYNRRVDVYLFNYEKSVVQIRENRPKIPFNIREIGHDKFMVDLLGLRYRVKVGLDKNMIKSDVIFKEKDVIIQNSEGKDLYTSGIFDNYDKARNHKEQLKLKGVKDPQIIPFIDARIISPSEVVGMTKLYPDLQEFLIDHD